MQVKYLTPFKTIDSNNIILHESFASKSLFSVQNILKGGVFTIKVVNLHQNQSVY